LEQMRRDLRSVEPRRSSARPPRLRYGDCQTAFSYAQLEPPLSRLVTPKKFSKENPPIR
jgi:hypothetical protein